MLDIPRRLLVPSVVSESCADVILGLDVASDDFFPCAKLSVSKAVGYAIILGAAILKVPIIINMLRASSAKGLSSVSLTLETTMYMSSFLYNFFAGMPFSTYGENGIILVQNIVIVALFLAYGGAGSSSSAAVIPAILGLFALVGYFLPSDYHFLLVAWTTICVTSSKLPQILQNFHQKHTGVLSLITLALQFVGGVARLGTLFQEVDDMLVIGNTSLAVFLNFIILAQYLVYASNTKKIMAKAKKE